MTTIIVVSRCRAVSQNLRSQYSQYAQKWKLKVLLNHLEGRFIRKTNKTVEDRLQTMQGKADACRYPAQQKYFGTKGAQMINMPKTPPNAVEGVQLKG